MKIINLVFFLLCLVSGSVYSQSNLSKKLLKNKWIPDCIEENCDTINLKRIIPRASYEYQKVIEFKGDNLLYYYYFNPSPKEPVFVCGTGELEITKKSTFSIISDDRISIDLEANILTDDFYTFKYKKDFEIEKVSKNEFRLICLKTYYYEEIGRK